MMIHEITTLVGKHKARKRIGRGNSSGTGKTSGRGHKGAASRSGWKTRPAFEGGQMQFFRRLPKRGFSNAMFRRRFHVINLKSIENRCDDGAEVTPELLAQVGLIRDTSLPVKVLGEGELTKKFAVTAAKFSASAKAKIEAAGGSVNEVARIKWTRAAAAAAAAANPKKSKKSKKSKSAEQDQSSDG